MAAVVNNCLILKIIFLSLLLSLLIIGTSKEAHKTSIIQDPKGLETDGLFSRLWDVVTPKGKISFLITKSVKHGSISLVLPSNMFTADLTVCMDISPNPGPARQNSSVTAKAC